MIYRLSVPAAVPDVDEIRVLEWHGKPGASFTNGALIVELETHKAIVEVRAAQAGVLRRILAAPGDWKAIGIPLALFSDGPDDEIPGDLSKALELAVDYEVT
jgi:pyruvate/2-oxoglutarate dehydrogenase complex dihydrolipoamide acyltransferase (E2) component